MSAEKKSITLKDIAAKTGYSINTVSHALQGKSDISDKTSDLIKKAADELGYIGNASASFLRSGISKTIAIILGDISNPHFSIMVREIESSIRDTGYTTIVLNTEEDESNEYRAISSAVQKNVDGIILCPVQKSVDNIMFLKKTGVPFVLIGRHFSGLAGESTDYVVCDDVNAGYVATKHLLDLGHRNILFLNGPLYISSAKERFEGYEKAFNELNLNHSPALIHNGSVRTGEWGAYLKSQLINNPAITAVIAFSDMIAWEIISVLNQMGRAVPSDISVVGFDNIQSKFIFPIMLTTVSSSKTTMAKTAAEVLMEKIGNDPVKINAIRIETKLIVRDTTAAI